MTINIYNNIDIVQYLADDIMSRKWQTMPALLFLPLWPNLAAGVLSVYLCVVLSALFVSGYMLGHTYSLKLSKQISWNQWFLVKNIAIFLKRFIYSELYSKNYTRLNCNQCRHSPLIRQYYHQVESSVTVPALGSDVPCISELVFLWQASWSSG